ncbi:DUF4362 domain-containing protein [Paenibacillus montanisoli]|uniref:DUF4362 domain-containing protein n=1 Tax=Paenibacillus montanisoli TaxID=2081970 RepID=A0A328U5C3_9BACL|nr:DUF4362 domain-containing protein [Paenibacillus montanisoli]RAP76125.1 hypothetical protein DL346_11955 [Paenibacillus montanisoli]
MYNMVKKAAIAGMVMILLLTACGQSKGGSTPNAADIGEAQETAITKGFPEVTDPYSPEQASANGDVVNVHGKYTNLEKWLQFMERVNAKSPEPASVRITQYTIEGDPIFYELINDGKQISYTFDNSKDAFGSDLGRPTTTCTGFDTKKVEQAGTFIVLTGCADQKTADTFYFDANAK